jgi:hypothetical protein
MYDTGLSWTGERRLSSSLGGVGSSSEPIDSKDVYEACESERALLFEGRWEFDIDRSEDCLDEVSYPVEAPSACEEAIAEL